MVKGELQVKLSSSDPLKFATVTTIDRGLIFDPKSAMVVVENGVIKVSFKFTKEPLNLKLKGLT